MLWYIRPREGGQRQRKGERFGDPEIDNAIPRLPLPPTNDVGGRAFVPPRGSHALHYDGTRSSSSCLAAFLSFSARFLFFFLFLESFASFLPAYVFPLASGLFLVAFPHSTLAHPYSTLRSSYSHFFSLFLLPLSNSFHLFFLFLLPLSLRERSPPSTSKRPTLDRRVLETLTPQMPRDNSSPIPEAFSADELEKRREKNQLDTENIARVT